MPIDTILLAVGPNDRDRLDRLTEETVDVAGPTGATVVVGHVFTQEEYDDALDSLDFDRDAGDISVDTVARRYSSVRETADRLGAANVDYEVRGAVGRHGETIVELAADVDADRVMVGGRRRSPTGKAVFGSVAQTVMLDAPCPVTFVRAGTE
ncbi:universal stress protein [Halobellus sp. GM3]|uniref:universal stress protein n=1 Tax=Halobellus sp. GM3 TaxID=3458410 RepID=UPI00403DEC2E